MIVVKLLIIIAVLLLAIGVPLAIVLMIVSRRKSRGEGPNACPACRGRFAGAAKFCPHCGRAMALDL